MSGSRTVMMGPRVWFEGNAAEMVLDGEGLRGGLASFLWASSRSMASLHPRAALTVRHLTGAAPATDGMRLLLAGSLVQFLFERYGMARLRRFFGSVEEAGVATAARSAFGKTLLEIARDWEGMLRSLEL